MLKRQEADEKSAPAIEELAYSEGNFKRRMREIATSGNTTASWSKDPRVYDNYLRATAFERRNPRIPESLAASKWQSVLKSTTVSASAKEFYGLFLEGKTSASLRYHFALLCQASLVELLPPEIQRMIMLRLPYATLRDFCKLSHTIHVTCMRYRMHSPAATMTGPHFGFIGIVSKVSVSNSHFAVLTSEGSIHISTRQTYREDVAPLCRNRRFRDVSLTNSVLVVAYTISEDGLLERWNHDYEAERVELKSHPGPYLQLEYFDNRFLSILSESGVWSLHLIRGGMLASILPVFESQCEDDPYTRFPQQSFLAAQNAEFAASNDLNVVRGELGGISFVSFSNSKEKLGIPEEHLAVVASSIDHSARISNDKSRILVYRCPAPNVTDASEYTGTVAIPGEYILEVLRAQPADGEFIVRMRSGKIYELKVDRLNALGLLNHEEYSTQLLAPEDWGSWDTRPNLRVSNVVTTVDGPYFFHEPAPKPMHSDAPISCIVCGPLSAEQQQQQDPLIDIHSGNVYCSEECATR